MNSSVNWPCAALQNAELAPRTTLRVGGSAAWLLEPATPDAFVAAWCAVRERGLEPRVLGGGANLIVADGTHPWVVIATDRMHRVFRPETDQAQVLELAAIEGANGRDGVYEPELPRVAHHEREREPRLVAWAGAGMPGLVRMARDLGWSGLEGLVGVPGNLGGGVAMNAGGRWGELWDVVESVRLLTPEGEVVERLRGECQPRYRDGNLGGAMVLGAELKLVPGDRSAIGARMGEYLAQKSAAQPVMERSAGCIFRNPDKELSDGLSAGELIERLGLKGRSRGDAVVSQKHGNFLVNRGRASACDVLELIDEVEREVHARTGIVLQREVKLWSSAAG